MLLLNATLRRMIRIGSIEVVDVSGRVHGHAGLPGPSVRVKLHQRSLYILLVVNPDLYLCEAYMNGTLTIERGTLRDLLTLFSVNWQYARQWTLLVPVDVAKRSFRTIFQRNSTRLARRNVTHHYDLSNELYRQFLDEEMNYSCAYFRSADEPLEAAQINKLRHIAAKLALKPGQRVLDIGCGWGSMAFYLARHFDVYVTGITLSSEQLALANERALQLGLEDKVNFRLCDYREISGCFDRIVSVGMFEHVGSPYFLAFFRKIESLLTRDGVAVVHSIGRTCEPGITAAWIRKYIFPGGYSPALSETFSALEKTGLWPTDVEILRLHYAQTLRAWSERFSHNRRHAVELMGEPFCRLWEFYLISSELSFSHFDYMVFQLQITKVVDTLPVERHYMHEVECRLFQDDSGSVAGA